MSLVKRRSTRALRRAKVVVSHQCDRRVAALRVASVACKPKIRRRAASKFDLEAGESKESKARILVERSKLSKSSRVSITKKVKTVEVGFKAVPISRVK